MVLISVQETYPVVAKNMITLAQRKATIEDLPFIIALLVEDDLGQYRESTGENIERRYLDAFHQINADPNQYLMVVIAKEEIVGTCHLTIMPSLTFTGSTRMQIEAVRVSVNHRNQQIGEWMMVQAVAFAKSKEVSIIQLSTNKQRTRAKQFYERIGFQATHEGMKYYL